MIEDFRLMLGDCLSESDKIESGSVDLILTDLPYGTIRNIPLKGYENASTDWDVVIDTDKIMQIANRILRKNGKMILFAQQPFTNELINKAIANVPFNYSMIWEKDHFANSLTAKKAPLNYYEDILVFSQTSTNETDIVRNYLIQEKNKSRLRNCDFDKIYMAYFGLSGITKRNLDHYWNKGQHALPTKEIYENVLQSTGFFSKPYSELKLLNRCYESTFNLWEGKKYKSNILKYKKDYDGHHPTQKPVLLLEDLIKTFSNEGDLVADITMGSGSTGVACINTGRKFIGIEKDESYFEIAKSRIEKAKAEYQPELFETLKI
jgi:DNA modification methylase